MRARQAAALAALVLPLAAGGFIVGRASRADGYELFRSVISVLANEGIDSLSADSLFRLASRGLVAAVDDPYAELFSPQDFARFSRNTLQNRYGGIGLRIIRMRGAVTVFRVIPGGPAGEAGVQRGDRIEAVNDSVATDWTTDRASNTLTGQPGTSVRVTFGRPRSGERYTVELTRRIITVQTVPFVATLEGGIGYIPLPRSFSDHSAGEVAEAAQRLSAAGARGLILDLRGNPGGSLEQAVALANVFLPQGQPVVRVRYRRQDDTLRGDRAPVVRSELPMVVLVDSASASASEIVAGALQDYDRAVLIGTTSFGKGLVQGAYNLPEGWVLRVTTGHWFTPSGRLIQRQRGDTLPGVVRPAFRSRAGRTVFGGGGITPDLFAYADTTASGDRALNRWLNERGGAIARQVLDDYLAELEPEATPTFMIAPAWRQEYVTRLRAAGLPVPDSLVAGGATFLDRLIDINLSNLALSDSATFVRNVPRDSQLARATALLRRAGTQTELFATLDRTNRQAQRTP